jgi:hypothetical protein
MYRTPRLLSSGLTIRNLYLFNPAAIVLRRAFSQAPAVKMPSKVEAGQKKHEGSKEGKQYDANPSKVKSARTDGEDAEAKSTGKIDGQDAVDCTQHWEDEQHLKDGQKAYQEFKEQNRSNEAASTRTQSNSGSAESDDQGYPTPKKRGHGANASGSNNKRKKGSSSEEPNGTAGDITRVPNVGQQVQWKALPGLVDGEVVEVAYEERTIEGKAVKASKEDPRIVLKSSSSGKIVVHKPEAVYFD